jgi:hypothetical protein
MKKSNVRSAAQINYHKRTSGVEKAIARNRSTNIMNSFLNEQAGIAIGLENKVYGHDDNYLDTNYGTDYPSQDLNAYDNHLYAFDVNEADQMHLIENDDQNVIDQNEYESDQDLDANSWNIYTSRREIAEAYENIPYNEVADEENVRYQLI